MKRRPLSLLLVLLVVVALGALVYRRADGPSLPAGAVQVRGDDGLSWQAFEVSEGGRVVVEATGSQSGTGVLEATAWILDRATRRVVWRMTPEKSRTSTGTLRLQTDTLQLPAGTYEAYFSGVGMTPREGGAFARMTNRSQTWRNDRAQWHLVVRALPGTLVARVERRLAPAPDLVWAAAPQSSATESVRLDVTRPTALRAVFAASEIGTGSRARITRVADGVVVWQAESAAATPAGGALRNRRVEATVALTPGLYDVVSEVPRDHAFDDWRQTPPDDPFAWGLSLRPATPADAGAVAVFDIWRRTPVARYEARTPETDHVIRFTVSEATPVVIAAMGEFTSSDRYDYAWLEDGAGTRLWEMRRSETTPGGGDDKNRAVEHLTTLAPGDYTLHFITDGSHHAGNFNSDDPDHPERYGVALFSLGPDGAIRLTGQSDVVASVPEPAPPSVDSTAAAAAAAADAAAATAAAPDDDTTSPPPAPPSAEGALAAIVRAGSSANERERFRIDGPSAVDVYATGERIGDTWYDWAQIEDDNRRVVWSMQQARTRRAGGAEKNRLFSGPVILPEGTYRLVYRTDGSHHYGSYDRDDEPTHNFWGAIVRRR